MGRTYVQFTGAESVIQNLLKLEGEIFPNTAMVLEKALQPVANAMKANATSMFNKGHSKGIMVNSIGVNVDYKKMEAFNQVAASVGVFDVANTGVGDYGTVGGRRITAPMLALFYEAGIQPHSTSSGSRSKTKSRPEKLSEQHDERNAERSKKGKGDIKMHPGSAPIPFISAAGESMMPGVLDQMDKEIDKILKGFL